MRSYKGRRNIMTRKLLLGLVILIAVFSFAYFLMTQVIKIPQNSDENNNKVVINNDQQSAKSENQPGDDKNTAALYIKLASGASAQSQLSQTIAELEGSSINTLGFDIGYMQIGKFESTAFDIKQLVKTAKDAGYKTIMRIDTLSFPQSGDIQRKNAVMTKNMVTWLDKTNAMWVNPYANDANEVIKVYCDAAKKYEFDMLELNKLGFFMEGRLNLVHFSENDSIQNRSAALVSLLTYAKDNLKDSGVKLGVSLDMLTLLDSSKASVAQDAKDFANQADVLIPYINISGTLSNKNVLSVINETQNTDAFSIYNAYLESLDVEKQKLMPLIDMSSYKEPASSANADFDDDKPATEKELIKAVLNSRNEYNLYGCGFYYLTSGYKPDNFQ